EELKASSAHLRGTIAEELAGPEAAFSAEAGQMLKFHGIYQQDNRDERRDRKLAGQPLAHSCMVRCSVPGGVLTADQWADIDALADDVGDGSLRLTSRQGVQYHFVNKGDLKELIRALDRGLVTTYAACGDVVRNIMVAPAPLSGRDPGKLQEMADALANRFRPRSGAYWELWLDGERAVSAGPVEPSNDEPDETVEPLYGATYLPRKFKIAITWPGDNAVDVFSQDVGIVPIEGPDGQPGAVLLAGGGLGRSHTDPTTFPRLADPLAWVPEPLVPDAVAAVVAVFRDHGDRADRSHARLKYVVDARGIDWVRDQVERRLGRRLADPVPLPRWQHGRTALGWHQQPDGRWFLGLAVPSGRLRDEAGNARRQAVREIVARYAGHVRLTPQQDLLLCDIDPADRPAVDRVLSDHGVPQLQQLTLATRSTMACPALPTCGQALGEAERILPEFTDLIDRLLTDRGLADLSIETRITGCPNGCSRPYVAELGIVGRTKTAYDLFVGGDPAGTRLAQPLIEMVPRPKLADVLGPLLDRFRVERRTDEGFGAWADRIGVAGLQEGLPSFRRPGAPRRAAVGA
ncbi:MAG: NADPH-dependent assimilatory sulfite reductase hemoprotein subunit, partial [Actinomycetota bacterium]